MIGHLAPLSGPFRSRGESAVRALQMALEDAHKEDWSAGPAITIRHVDGAGDRGRAEAVRLLSVNRVAALIVGPGVHDLDAILTAAQAQNAPTILLDDVAEVPAGIMALGSDPGERGRILARYLASQLRVGGGGLIVDERDRVMSAFAETFREGFRRSGGELEERSYDAWIHESGEPTLGGAKLIVLAVSAQRVRDVVEPSLPAPIPVVLVEDSFELMATSLRPRVLYRLGSWAPEATAAGSAATFSRAFEKRYSRKPNRDAMLALDAIRLLMDVAGTSKSPDREGLRQSLRGLTTFDAATDTITWVKGQPRRTLYLDCQEGEKRTLVERFPPRREELDTPSAPP